MPNLVDVLMFRGGYIWEVNWTFLDLGFSIVPWTLFRPWTLYPPWTLWRMHFEKLYHSTWRSFAAAPHVTHALRVVSSAHSFSIVPWTLFWPWTLYWPWTLWRMHFEKLHHITWRGFAATPHVTHALRVASSACSFSIVSWTLFRPHSGLNWGVRGGLIILPLYATCTQ